MSRELDELDEIRDDAQDLTGLKRKVQQLLGQNRKLKDRVKELETGKPAADASLLDRFFTDAPKRLVGLEGEARQAELAKIRTEADAIVDAQAAESRRAYGERVERLKQAVHRITRERAAQDLVMKLRRPGVDAAVLMPHVLERLTTDERDGEAIVTAKGATGEPVTMEQLAAEFRTNPAFSRLIEGASEAEKQAHARAVAETLGRPKEATH